MEKAEERPLTRPNSVMLAALRETSLRMLTHVTDELWTRAVPEQQRLTIQLCRNSIYFTLSVLVIRLFGDQLAV